MSGLRNWKNWRNFMVAFVLGYIVAWGMHWATTLYNKHGVPVHNKIPLLTP